MGPMSQLTWVVVAVIALLVIALIISRLPKWIKAGLILLATGSYFFVHQVAEDLSGWPSKTALPERFVLLAAVIEEPKKGQTGRIFVWLEPLPAVSSQSSPASTSQRTNLSRMPRAYELPYGKDLHSLLEESKKKMRQGVSQLGTAEPKRGKQGFSWLKAASDEQEVKLRDMPIPQLPEK
jgi:hypothetical protein